MKKYTEKQQIAFERRNALRDLSNTLQKFAKAAGMEENPNELLRNYYAQAGHTELKSFEEWKKAGFYVKKGEKAILLWGRPRTKRKKKENTNEQNESEETEEEFFPVAYLFSQKQVEKKN